jgi:hypothetical protein
MLAKIPSAAARTQAQAHIWGAVVDLDLATRAARRCGEKGPPAVELRNSLTHPFVLDCVSAKDVGGTLPRDSIFMAVLFQALAHRPERSKRCLNLLRPPLQS